MKRVLFSFLLCCSLTIASITLSGCGQKTYESPTAVFEAAQAASSKRDMEDLMNCLTEESQETFVEMLVGFFGMMKGFAGLAGEELPEPIAKLDKVMKKHGLSDKVLEEMEDESYPVKDKAALVGDFFKASGMGSKTRKLPPMWNTLTQPTGKLADVSINGDTATATAVDGDTREMVSFKKIDGGWLIHLGTDEDPGYPAEWPDLGESSEEWLTHPLSEEEVERLEVILASVDRLDGFDEEQKALLDRAANLSHDAFATDGDEFDFNSPVLLKGKPFTGFTKLGSTFERWKEGKTIFSVMYRTDSSEGFKLQQRWPEDSNHVARGTTMSWHENGQKASQRLFKDGKQESTTSWHENGQKAGEATYKDGKRNGPATSWHKNRQKSTEATFKDDKKDGPATRWHENGQKSREETYTDGKRDGLRTRWHENGQKDSEALYQEGRKVGLETTWHENGQKKSEITWKQQLGHPGADSLRASVKYWNSKGEEVETYQESKK